ncbi:MAG TPA: HlyD family secretion protein [Verrucomicrobiae bacterium]|nr:HlyD family secretion protein [Verrucomicrobiae bacterium]
MEKTETQEKTASPHDTGKDSARRSKPTFWKRKPVIIVGTIVLAGIFLFGLNYLLNQFTHESTDNAFIDADIVSIAPKVSGRVKSVLVEQNQPVKAGDLLVEIDPRDFEVELAQKKAALASAQANVAMIKASFEYLATEVQTAQSTVKQSQAEAAADQARLDKANSDLKRAEDLFQRKIISPQEFDAAKSAAAAAEANFHAAQEKVASDQSKVAAAQAQLDAGRKAFDRAQAQSQEAKVEVSQAELNVSYTKITAPADGRITRKAVVEGDYIQTGQKLMALVENHMWVTANFKETQLANIRVGQPVKISIDSVSDETFSGHVESIQSGSGAAFSLLPPENAVGNYVKVVQRVPVRIFFNGPLQTKHVIGPGMSVTPSVQINDFSISEVVLVIIAAALAIVAGFLWWHLTTRKKNS